MHTTPAQRGKERSERFQMPERSIHSQVPAKGTCNHDNMLRGARNFAQGNPSDPFAYARCVAHINSGVASLIVDDKSGRTTDGFYDGKLSLEGRSYTRPGGEVENYNVETVVDMKA